jgi:hypothetical protein
LDDTNYDNWKAKMVVFLKCMHNKTWKAVIKGWIHPVTISPDGTSSLKPKTEWINAEDNDVVGNSKALNVIYNGVDRNMFRLINACTKAKEAWEILKTSHEVTSKVRMSRFQLLTIKFENLIMYEDESIFDFNIRMCDIACTFLL